MKIEDEEVRSKKQEEEEGGGCMCVSVDKEIIKLLCNNTKAKKYLVTQHLSTHYKN